MRIRPSAASLAILLVSGCTGLQEKVDGNIGQADSKLSTLVKDVGRPAPGVVTRSPAPVVHNSGIWIGQNVVKRRQETLPAIFHQPAVFDRTVFSLSELAERITLRSGIPTKVSPDALAVSEEAGLPEDAGTANQGASARPRQSSSRRSISDNDDEDDEREPVRITYSNGTFKGLLDTASARFGVYWKYSNGAVHFFHTDSRTFQIHAVPGNSTLVATVASGAVSTGGTGGASGDSTDGGISANNTQNTAVTSQLAVYSSIERSINAMMSSYGKVVSSPATGTITVVDTPDMLERIAEFVEAENQALSRQVVINVTVLAVTLDEMDEYGINWDLVYSNLRNTYGIKNTIASSKNSVGFSAGILDTSSSKFAGSSVVINALSEQGKVRRHTSASVVTLNNQPVPVQVAKQTSYLKSSETTVTAQVGTTTSLTPGTVTSGFNMSILPHILSNGTVMLQFSTDISSLRSIRTVSSGGSSIETPEMDTRNFLQRVAMKSNETLIISGFEQTEDNLGRQGVGKADNYLFGGGYKARSGKEVIVILVTPTTMGS